MKTETIRGHLCQKCLNKVLESLEFRKWKYEKKEAVPLCLVDFKRWKSILFRTGTGAVGYRIIGWR